MLYAVRVVNKIEQLCKLRVIILITHHVAPILFSFAVLCLVTGALLPLSHNTGALLPLSHSWSTSPSAVMPIPPEIVDMIAQRAPAETRGVCKLWKAAANPCLFQCLFIKGFEKVMLLPCLFVNSQLPGNFNKKMLFLLRREDEKGKLFTDNALATTCTFYFVYPTGVESHKMGHTINLGYLTQVLTHICPKLRRVFELFFKNVPYSVASGCPPLVLEDHYFRPCIGWLNFKGQNCGTGAAP